LNPIMLTFSVIILFSISANMNKNDNTESPPNIIIIYTDDQGTLDAGCYGANDLYTPNIDRLSRSGIRFTQAYAHTVCCSSRAAMLTGRHPQRSGITNWTQNDAHAKEKGINMPLSEVTIAEVLKENGYRTGIFGKWHLGAAVENGPLEQGFDKFYGIVGGIARLKLQSWRVSKLASLRKIVQNESLQKPAGQCSGFVHRYFQNMKNQPTPYHR